MSYIFSINSKEKKSVSNEYTVACMQVSRKFVRRLYTSGQKIGIYIVNIHDVEYLDKPIKCLGMRANIKSK